MTALDIDTTHQYDAMRGMPTRKTTRKPRRITTLRLVRECSFIAPDGYPADDIAIASPRDVFERMAPYAERETVEVFWLLCLNAQHRLIGNAPEAVTRGILNSSLVHPREVFVHAIVARAASLILCHNHPSGDPAPSLDDRAVTEQLVAAGRLLDIPVMDHVIIGRGLYTSFRESGLL